VSERPHNNVSQKHSEIEPVAEPINQDEWGKHGEYELVGQGKVTDPDTCGKFGGFWGCPHTELHNKTTLDGKNHKDKVYVKKFFTTATKRLVPSATSWAGQSARRAT
jgi:hypothetical protein